MRKPVILIFSLQLIGLLLMYWGIHGGGVAPSLIGLGAVLGSAVTTLVV